MHAPLDLSRKSKRSANPSRPGVTRMVARESKAAADLLPLHTRGMDPARIE
jgi:hypothetical protein